MAGGDRGRAAEVVRGGEMSEVLHIDLKTELWTCAKCGKESDDTGWLSLQPPGMKEVRICVWCLCEVFGLKPEPEDGEVR